jgi:hypothetical protein
VPLLRRHRRMAPRSSTRWLARRSPRLDRLLPLPAVLGSRQEEAMPCSVVAVLSRALDGLDSSSASSASTPGTPTTGTSGPSSGGSSATAALQSSLASRLRARMDGFGSPEYALRWNESATPLGPPILQRQALARRTSDSDSSGWPTPMAGNAGNRGLQPGGEHGQQPEDGGTVRLGIPFRNGKQRRVESGTFPLAHGVPGRVGLLRGYGNAIVPQVAAEFIAASLEARGER